MCSNVLRTKTKTENTLKHIITLLCVVASAALILYAGVSCRDTEAIFAGIETEERIETNNLSEHATVLGMAVMNNNYLIATGGAMFYRNVNGTVWDVVELPDGHEGVSRIVEITKNERAYAVLVKDYYTDPSEWSVYRLGKDANIVSFEKLHSSKEFLDIKGQQGVDTLFAMRGKEHEWQYYANYQDANPILLSSSREVNSETKTETVHSAVMVGVAQIGYDTPDATDDTFVFANEYGVFEVSDDLSTLTRLSVSANISTLKGYVGGIYYSALYDKLLVSEGRFSERGGFIWETEDAGGSWKRSDEYSNDFFTQFMDIEQSAFTGIIAGTRYFRVAGLGLDRGYKEFLGGNMNSTRTPLGNKYTSGKLDQSGVLDFYLHEELFFVFTSNNGLWRGTYSDSRVIDWFLE